MPKVASQVNKYCIIQHKIIPGRLTKSKLFHISANKTTQTKQYQVYSKYRHQ